MNYTRNDVNNDSKLTEYKSIHTSEEGSSELRHASPGLNKVISGQFHL